MGIRQQAAHDAGRGSRIDQVIDDQEAAAIARGGRWFHNHRLAALLLLIGDNADAFDQAKIQLTSDDRRWDQAAPADRDNAGERAMFHQAPGQGTGVAVQLIPGDGVVVRCHAGSSAKTGH